MQGLYNLYGNLHANNKKIIRTLVLFCSGIPPFLVFLTFLNTIKDDWKSYIQFSVLEVCYLAKWIHDFRTAFFNRYVRMCRRMCVTRGREMDRFRAYEMIRRRPLEVGVINIGSFRGFVCCIRQKKTKQKT